MPIQPTYPGVYVEEIPSGVRTIVGVSTSVALFIGRAARGPLNKPILCLNPSDFERVFSNDTTFSDLPRAIRLFFQNGGTQCYVTRIADGAEASTVTLLGENENGGPLPVLTATAKAEGTIGNTTRLSVTYSGQHPESGFNIEVFRWETNNAGQLVKADREVWQGLSMDPQSPRYAQTYISQNSQLINITDLNAAVDPTEPSTSRAGRLTPADSDPAAFRSHWRDIVERGIGAIRLLEPWTGTSTISVPDSSTYSGLSSKQITFSVEGTEGDAFIIGTDATVSWDDGASSGSLLLDGSYAAGDNIAVTDGLELAFAAGNLIGGESFSIFVHPPAYRFRMSINGGTSWIDVSLLNAFDFDGIGNAGDFIDDLQDVMDNAFSSGNVDVEFSAGPTGLQSLQFTSNIGDIRIEPATENDLARILMLGSAQGGVEISRFASRRPAPTGLVFNLNNWNDLAGLNQDAFSIITIDGADIDLEDALQTLSMSVPSQMYQDGMPVSTSGGFDGVREKLGIIANAINSYRVANPTFVWAAQVAGNRLVLTVQNGSDNHQGSIASSGGTGTDIGSFFVSNVRHYALGPDGQGSFQTPGTTGNDGNAPTLNNLQDAFAIIDKEVDIFNLMILPRDADHNSAAVASMWGPASIFCQQRRAFLLIDPPEGWTNVQEATNPTTGVNSLRIGLVKDHSAIYFPRLKIRENGLEVMVGPSGAIAGLMARIDSNRGVWKAPAGTEADIRDVVGLEYRFSDGENGVLNPQGINTLRVFPNGIVSWGARTMDGDDDFASEWKYVPIRRLALFIEESLYRGLQWVVFEPNDEPLWSQIRLNVGAFMNNLFRQGAFQGQKRSDAYFVKCDSETTTQNDINLGIVNIWVGFAPLKPAEFVIIKLQQIAGQIEV